jgi:hypothetical protein
MILDNDLLFSDAQAVTAAAASTNYYDTGPLFTGNTGRNIGMGENLYFSISVDTAMTDSSSDSTLAVTLETDDNTSFSSAATVATLVTIPAVTAAGTKYFVKVPIATTVPYERYIRCYFTPANGNLTTGAFTVALVKDPDNWTSYASAVSTGI